MGGLNGVKREKMLGEGDGSLKYELSLLNVMSREYDRYDSLFTETIVNQLDFSYLL